MSTAQKAPEAGLFRPKAVIFDMDGLMLDSERLSLEFRRRIHEARGLPFENLLPYTMGRNTEAARPIYLAHYGQDYPFEEIRAEIGEMWSRYLRENPVPVKPGLFPLLDYLRERGVPAAVATSTSRESALPKLEKAGIAPYLTAMVFGDMVKRSKPEPDIFLTAAARLGEDPAGCMVLEDSPNGILAARRAGMAPVMVPDTVQPDEATKKLLYSCVERLDQVITLMEEMEDEHGMERKPRI